MDTPLAATAAALVLLRDAVTSLFVLADTSLVFLSSRSKPLRLIRSLLLSSFLLLLRLLPTSLDLAPPSAAKRAAAPAPLPPSPTPTPLPASSGDSGISRALSQLLSIVNNLPVSSRKYEAVRSLAERVIDGNHRDGSKALLEVNRAVLSSAFSRTLGQLEAAMIEMERDGRGTKVAGGYDAGNSPLGCYLSGKADDTTGGGVGYGTGKVLRAASGVARWGVRRLRGGKCEGGGGGIVARLEGSGSCAEKLAAELVWLGHKMTESGCAEEAVSRWASATNLAWLAISAQPRLQGSIVKVSAFLFKQAKEIGAADESLRKEELRLTRMKMLMSWLPLLCSASNGTDVPVLSLDERAELERVLDQTIATLEEEEEQEQVLSQWLHHFMYCPSSDWPNLHASYSRWCAASRRLLTPCTE